MATQDKSKRNWKREGTTLSPKTEGDNITTTGTATTGDITSTGDITGANYVVGEDGYIGIGAGTERLTFDGTAGYIYTDGAHIRLRGGKQLQIDDTDSSHRVQIYHNGTDGNIDVSAGKIRFNAQIVQENGLSSIWYSVGEDKNVQLKHDDTYGILNSTSSLLLRTTAGATILQPKSDEVRIYGDTATSSPYISFTQAGTRKSFIQHNDANDQLILVSEFGDIVFKTATDGAEVERLKIGDDGNVTATGVVRADGGFNISGTAGVTGTFQDFSNNTITVSGGLIVGLT